MARTVRAIYESGSLRLLETLNLDEGQAVLVTVDETPMLDSDQQALIELLRSWRNAEGQEAQEQRETLEYLKQALDEDRLSDRKLFP